MSTPLLKIRGECEEPYIDFYVDGEDLGRRVKAALGEAGFEDCLPWNGIDYDIEETVIGESACRIGANGAVLFACGCGCYACGGVSADMLVRGDTITLQNISTWRGGKNVIAPMNPITFDRQQYEIAVAKLRNDVAAWRPPPRKPKEPVRILITPPPAEK